MSTITDRRYGLNQGLAVKAPVRLATTAPIALAGLHAIDGVTPAEGDRVLVKDQADAVENGIYVASTGTWRRAADCNGVRDVTRGTKLTVTSGTQNAGKQFWLTTDSPVVGSTALAWDFISEAAEAAAEAAGWASESAASAALAAGFASDIVSQGNVPVYATVLGLASLEIPAGIAALATWGYAAIGDGGGWPLGARVSAEPTHAAKVRSADRYMPDGSEDLTNGGWWELRAPAPSPRMFGAVGDGVTDDAVPLQAFFDYVGAVRCDKAVVSGTFGVSVGLTRGLAETRLWEWDARFNALDAIPLMLDLQGVLIVDHGTIRLHGTGDDQDWSTLTCDVGVRLTTAQRSMIEKIHVERFRVMGVQVTSLAPGSNSNLLDIGSVIARDCGPACDNDDRKVIANWDNRVDTGSSGSGGQRSTIEVDAFPPDHPTARGTCLVVIGGLPHFVTDFDEIAGTISVFPWIDLSLTSGTLFYVFGGAVVIEGADAGITNVNQIDATRCSFGLLSRSLYGPVAKRIVTQVCAAGLGIGATLSGAHIGTTINGIYFEGNLFDILRVTTTSIVGVNIHGTYALNLAKCHALGEPRTSGNVLNYQGGFANLNIRGERNLASAGKAPNNLTGSTVAPALGAEVLHRANSVTVALPAWDAAYNRLYGHDDVRVVVVGTGIDGRPTGTITVNAPSGWTVNGGSSVALSGFTGPAILLAYYLIAETDVKLSVLRGDSRRLSADKGDAAATLTPGTSETVNVWNTPLTTNRAVTLSTTGAFNGSRFRIVRTAAATGGSSLNVGTGPLKALAAGEWCDVEYDGSAWVLTAAGDL